MPIARISAALTVAMSSALIFFAGCNLYEAVDEATTREELIEEAKAALDDGDCTKAIAAVNAIGTIDDQILKLRGWGELCTAGVTIKEIGKTVLKYDPSNANDYTLIGNLANNLVPSTQEHYSRIQNAINTFLDISDATERNTNLTFAYIVEAAALIALEASNNESVRRSDIYSAAACVGATCAASPATCGAGMGNAEANDVAFALDNAATAAGSLTELGVVADLARNIGNDTDNTAPNITRCVIVNNMLSQ